MATDQVTKNALILAVIKAWQLHPHLRFGQLVSNVLDADPFYVEDEEALRWFQHYANGGEL